MAPSRSPGGPGVELLRGQLLVQRSRVSTVPCRGRWWAMIHKHNPQGFVSGYAFFQNKKDVNMGCPREKSCLLGIQRNLTATLSHGPSGDRWTARWAGLLSRRRGARAGLPRSPSWPPRRSPRLPREPAVQLAGSSASQRARKERVAAAREARHIAQSRQIFTSKAFPSSWQAWSFQY